MESTDRMQVRDLIEKLQQFDTKARVMVEGHGFEILDVSKGDNCRVKIDIGKSDCLEEIDQEIERLESEIEDLREEITKLKFD